MNLLVVSTWLPCPADNGSRLRANRLLKELSRRHTITLLSFGQPPGPEEARAFRPLCDRLEVVPGPVRGPLGLRGLLSPIPRHFVQTDSPAMRALVAREVRRDYDAAVGFQVEAARYLASLAPALPAVFEEAEVGVLRDAAADERHLARRLRRGLTWWKHRRFVASLVRQFDRTTVVSEVERAHLAAIGCDPRRVLVVPNGIDTSPGQPARERDLCLIYPGAVTYSANLDAVRFFIDQIFPRLRQRYPGLVFRVTGATDGVDIGDLTRVDGVEFTGRLPDVGPAIARSAACVVPVRVGGGTRLKILHAMAVGTPVVSTAKGAEGLEVLADRHLLVADSAEDFARQVGRLLDQPDVGRTLATAARALVRDRYAWEPIARRLEGIIQTVVGEHRSARAAPGARVGP
jgi:glycosyltransferase involved in cell wall biosynthesis